MQDIRSGAHAVVLRARVLSSGPIARLPAGARVAVKRPRRTDLEWSWLIAERERLLLLGSLGSPGIVELLDHEAEGHPPFIVMPWYDFDLDTWKKHRNPTIDQRLRVLMQVTTGLLHLHRAPRTPNEVWIHRDLKPQNILVRETPSRNGDESVIEAVIADLSILKVGHWDSQMSQTGAGTRNYAPPGALLPRKAPPDPTVDGFALAVIAFEIFTGQRPDVAIQSHLMPAGTELANLAALNESELLRFQASYEAHRERPLRELVDLSRFEALRAEEEELLTGALRGMMSADVRSPDLAATALSHALVGALRPLLEPDPERRTFSLPALYEACQCGLDILEHARGRPKVRLEGTHTWELEPSIAPVIGGQAVVMRARREGQGELVAVKVTRDSGESAAWLENERQIMERMGPENQYVPKIFDHGRTAEGRRFLIMEWFPLTLRSWLDQTNPTLEQRLAAMSMALDALCALHETARTNELCLHRDLKPDNFLVDPAGSAPRVVLADLGCGLRARMSRRMWSSGVFTPPYAPPEQWLPVRVEPNAGVDLYAMAVTLYEILLGCVPDATQQRANVLNEEGGRLMALLGLASARSADDELELRALSELRVIDLMDMEACPPLAPSDGIRLKQRLFEHLAEQAPSESDARLERLAEGVTEAFCAALEPALRVDPAQRVTESRRLRAALFRATRALESACAELRSAARARQEVEWSRREQAEKTPALEVSAEGDRAVEGDPSTDGAPWSPPGWPSLEPVSAPRPPRGAGAPLRVWMLGLGFLVGLVAVPALDRLRSGASLPAAAPMPAATLALPDPGEPAVSEPPSAASAPELSPPEEVAAPVSAPSRAAQLARLEEVAAPLSSAPSPAPQPVSRPPLVLLSWNCSASGVIGQRQFPKSRSPFRLNPGRYALLLTNGVGQTIEHPFSVEERAGRDRGGGAVYSVSGDFLGGQLELKSEDVSAAPSQKLEFLCP